TKLVELLAALRLNLIERVSLIRPHKRRQHERFGKRFHIDAARLIVILTLTRWMLISERTPMTVSDRPHRHRHSRFFSLSQQLVVLFRELVCLRLAAHTTRRNGLFHPLR